VEPSAQKPDSQGPAKVMRTSLRTAIVVSFFCFGLILTAPLAWYNYSRNSEAALEVAGSLFEQTGTNVSLRTKVLLQPFAFLGDNVHLLPGADARPSGFFHPLQRAFQDILEDNPQIYSVYFGYGDGGFYQIVSLVGRPKVAVSLGAPAQALFAVRSIELRGTARSERWQFLDKNRRELASSPLRPAQYDPRTRPWFTAAARLDGQVRTSPYLFSSTQELGLTVSRRIDVAKIGVAKIDAPRPLVFGMDLTLESLSRFLAQEKIGRSGLLLLFDSGGGLIGHSDASRMTIAGRDKDGAPVRERASMETLGDPVAKAVYGRFLEAGKAPLPRQLLRVDGVDYLL